MGKTARARGVPLSMSRTRSEYLDEAPRVARSLPMSSFENSQTARKTKRTIAKNEKMTTTKGTTRVTPSKPAAACLPGIREGK